MKESAVEKGIREQKEFPRELSIAVREEMEENEKTLLKAAYNGCITLGEAVDEFCLHYNTYPWFGKDEPVFCKAVYLVITNPDEEKFWVAIEKFKKEVLEEEK